MQLLVNEFQSTRPHGARQFNKVADLTPIIVSIHAPARGATSPAHGCERHGDVSIHAPARGATAKGLGSGSSAAVSIHAPARGATYFEIGEQYIRTFQSTRPHGARLPALVLGAQVPAFQSTRPHGARRGGQGGVPSRCSFNPRARTGRDTGSVRPLGGMWVFQSTRPHGARPLELDYPDPGVEFQSTRPHGARPLPPSSRCQSS